MDAHVLEGVWGKLCFLTVWISLWTNGIGQASMLSKEAIADIDNFIQSTLACRNMPGLSLAIVSQNEVLHRRGYGYADIEKQKPVDEYTLFPIGSTTKAFTTAVLAMLLEDTIFDWETPIKKIDPKFELYNDILTNHVTLRDVLTHRTGIPGYFVALMAGFPEDMTLEQLTRKMSHHPPIYSFRTHMSYNNYMYALAGYIAELLANRTWDEIIRKKIFEPLNMTSSIFINDLGRDITRDRADIAVPYVYRNKSFMHIDLDNLRQVTLASPAGAILSNAVDMTSWVQLHLRHGKTESGKSLLSVDSLNSLFETSIGGHSIFYEHIIKPTFPVSDVASSYALGWINNVYRGYRRIWHSGGLLSFKSQVWLLPGLDAGMFLVSNGPYTRGSSWAMVNIAQYITDHLAGEKPWLNTSTVCTFPAPWMTSHDGKEQDDEEFQDQDEKEVDNALFYSVEHYMGTYYNEGFGHIIILYNNSAERLQMNFGIFLEALLYHTENHSFETKMINRYWYDNDKIPLHFKDFKNINEAGDGKFWSVHMPLCKPYSNMILIEFIRDDDQYKHGSLVNGCICVLASSYFLALFAVLWGLVRL